MVFQSFEASIASANVLYSILQILASASTTEIFAPSAKYSDGTVSEKVHQLISNLLFSSILTTFQLNVQLITVVVTFSESILSFS
jgi:hypothetical protein